MLVRIEKTNYSRFPPCSRIHAESHEKNRNDEKEFGKEKLQNDNEALCLSSTTKKVSKTLSWILSVVGAAPPPKNVGLSEEVVGKVGQVPSTKVLLCENSLKKQCLMTAYHSSTRHNMQFSANTSIANDGIHSFHLLLTAIKR